MPKKVQSNAMYDPFIKPLSDKDPPCTSHDFLPYEILVWEKNCDIIMAMNSFRLVFRRRNGNRQHVDDLRHRRLGVNMLTICQTIRGTYSC
mmetsp:Transcript_36274/g.75465  ORF Transcript_36274/g.75465 Transcript_36274/m.75465 type:complete len:91 (-) Transcript_36274:959-1231(-)